MGNETTKNPMILDSTGTINFTAFPITHGNRLLIKRMVWRNPTTDGHTLTLTLDGVAITRKAVAGMDSVILDADVDVSTFVVTTITSGTVEVWLR